MKDPVPAYGQRLLAEAVLPADELASLEARVQSEVDEAMRFGRESEYPAPEQALERLYA